MEVLKVSSKSAPNSVAGAIAAVVKESGAAELQAVAVARGYMAPSGVNLICIPAFTTIAIDGEEKTGIKLIVEPR